MDTSASSRTGGPKMKITSIKFKLLIIPLICLFVGIVAIALISSVLIRESLFAEMKNNGFSSAQRFVLQLEDNTNTLNRLADTAILPAQLEAFSEQCSYQAMVDKFANDDNIVYLAIVDRDVIDIADSIIADVGTDYSDEVYMKAAAQEGVSSASQYYYEDLDIDVYEVNYPLTINGDLVGAITIGYSMANVQSAVTNNMLLIAGIGLLIFLILALVLYRISNSVTRPVKAVNQMIQEMSQGYLGTRLKMKPTNEIGQMAVALDQFADTLQLTLIGTLNQIAVGDLSAEIKAQGPRDEITPALKQTIENIGNLIAEAKQLSAAAVAGQLDSRGDADRFSGGFKEIVAGVNDTLDAVVGPLHVAADYVERIGKGEIPPPITATYQGDFNTIKNSINACIDGLGALEEGKRILGKLALNDYSETMDTNYPGIYSEIGRSINQVCERLASIVTIANKIAAGNMSDLPLLKKLGARGDKDQLSPAIIAMLQNIVNLVAETEAMASHAIAGNLSHRSDLTGFSGEYAKVIAGLNQTLDAVAAPLNEASITLQQLAQGNLNSAMVGSYQGDYAIIKADMNQTISFLKRYVEEITAILEEIGQGNLDQHISADYLGDFQAIKKALNQITANLSATMTEINIAAGQVESGSQQISDGGQALSQGTTEQASAIEQLTASIDEVASETKKNAVNANQANQRAIEVRSSAQYGNQQMQKMVAAMADINEASHSISKVIKVIDDIAFQTNILALNAAVEAARAGQHGKGFAVVAEEVRSLAGRSAAAAKETTGLIEGSINKVEVGAKIADQTEASLIEILQEIEKVADLVGNIARASNDQATEIAQITSGIEQVSTVVQTNSATAEESAAASQELSGQAEVLKQMVDAFKIKNVKKQAANPQARPAPLTPATGPAAAPPRINLDDWDDDKY